MSIMMRYDTVLANAKKELMEFSDSRRRFESEGHGSKK